MLSTKSKAIIFCSILMLSTNKCFAQDAFSPIKIINTNVSNTSQSEVNIDLDKVSEANPIKISLTENDTFYNLANATDKFLQCNIKAAWDDFKALINNAPDNDFIYMALANKMSDLGFFDLANFATSKIKDKDLTYISTDAMKRFYYPRRKPKLDAELSLAEAYSNIMYNNQSSEAANELLKNETVLSDYDYANYLIALGSYKSSFYSRAAKYINIALIQNPSNLNYQKLKAQILAETDEPQEAIKIVENLKKQNLYSYEYERKIKSLEQFVLYKTQKAEWAKNYHLGYYYYLENDSSKAIRLLQTALSCKRKNDNGLIQGLMSEIYLSMDEFEKAADTAQKAYSANKNCTKALITLGDLSYQDKNYKKALSYYKRAANTDKKSYIPFVKEAQAYQKINNEKKAREIYAKVLKTHSESWEAYYNVALLDKDKHTIYLKKALAVNPMFEDGWIELAKTTINSGNYDIAQKYLFNAFYIDENDYRYYYYQGVVNANSGNMEEAKFNFKKCLKLNSNFTDAQAALDGILNVQNGNSGGNL